MATYHKVTAGPSKFDLMLSLFEGKSIAFTLEDGAEVKGVAFKMTVMDRANDYVYIEGNIDQEDPIGPKVFCISFHWRTRKGDGVLGEGRDLEQELIDQQIDHALDEINQQEQEGIDLEMEEGFAEIAQREDERLRATCGVCGNGADECICDYDSHL